MFATYITYLKELMLKLNLYYIYSTKIGMLDNNHIKNVVCQVQMFLGVLQDLDDTVDDDLNYFEEIKHYIKNLLSCIDTVKMYSIIYDVGVASGSASGTLVSSKERQYLFNSDSTISTDNGATGIILPETPTLSIRVKISGFVMTIGNALKTKEIYFSDDGGVTAKARSKISSGDELFYNALVIGEDLLVTDEVEIIVI